MTETPKCPYCGAETRLNENNEGIYWYECRECNATGPTEKTPVEAFSAAIHRAEPENRPLTLEEVMELGKDEDSIVYLEPRRLGGCGWYQPCASIFDSSAEGQKNEIHFDEPGNDLPEFWPEAEYGKTLRCWPRKPAPEQMAAEKWEE